MLTDLLAHTEYLSPLLTPHGCPATAGDLQVRVATVTMTSHDGKRLVLQDDFVHSNFF
jgi:hypothetical protein